MIVLERVVVDMSSRTVHLYGEDGEYESVSCNFDDEGAAQFGRIVQQCQDQLPEDFATYLV